jgi:serine protease Do
LGVSIGQLNSDMAEQFGVKPNEGLVVGEVMPKSPAAEAGFHEGDLITEFAGKPVHKPRDLQSIVEQSAPGEKHEAKLLRAGKPMTLMVTVKPLPAEARVAAEHEEKDATKESSGPSYQAKDWGFEVTDLTPDTAEQFGYQDHKGVVITGVSEDGVAAERGLREGMLVKMVGNQRVTNVDEFKSAMARHPAGKDLMLLVRSGQNQTYIVLKK